MLQSLFSDMHKIACLFLSSSLDFLLYKKTNEIKCVHLNKIEFFIGSLNMWLLKGTLKIYLA